ncbi:MAG: NAD-dependent epimerase/dehydratase family protein [Dyella sp.]|uniref:NAD-dependent epimerase/dehydratase family protein n=1 Tax=Dyella sp. TaxID=1869338 RepID=UPI003F7E3AA4
MNTTRTALIVGANGGIGQAMIEALRRHGWAIRALVRSSKHDDPYVDWRLGDAMNAEDVRAAAEGVQLIVHAVNPPGYRDWQRLVLPMVDNTIAAACAVGARILLPGTIYNFGPDAFPRLSETSPQHPTTAKGAIRVELERRLAAAAERGARVLILRCGDFFGPHAGNSWFAQGLVQPGKPVRTLCYPGAPEHRHAWAYLPDVAQTASRLLERDAELADFEVFHFGGYFVHGRELCDAVRRASGNTNVRLGRFPWWLVTLAAPFVVTLRELRKMRYLWRTPIALDDRKLVGFLGDDCYTPLEQALRRTLDGLGCLPAADAAVSAQA